MSGWTEEDLASFRLSEAIDKANGIFSYGGGNGDGPAGEAAQLEAITASSITPENVRWLWQGWLPLRSLSLLAGIPGLGKTTLALLLAALTTRGQLEGTLRGQPVDVLVASLEDSPAHTLVPRLMAANADLDRIHFIQCTSIGGVLDLTRHVPEIDALVQQRSARLLIVDPLVATLPAGKLSSHSDQDVRSVLALLSMLADQRDLSAVACMHFSKSAADALLGVGGSIGFVAATRSLLIFGADPNDERGEEGPARVLAHRKCNLGRRQPSRAVHIIATDVDTDDGGRLGTSKAVLGDEVDVSADDLVQVRGRKEQPRVEAVKFLRQLLRDGPHRVTEILDLAEDAGITEKTLRRAKRDIGADSFQKDREWWWVLSEEPEGEQEEPGDDPGEPA